MHFIAKTSSNGVVERNFTLGEITGLLWSPASGSDHAPLVLMAHSGGQHKGAPFRLKRPISTPQSSLDGQRPDRHKHPVRLEPNCLEVISDHSRRVGS
jgi:hypothetical protein